MNVNTKSIIGLMAAISTTALFPSCGSGSGALTGKYPVAPTSETVDTIHGLVVADPYRPLEDDTAAVTLEWVKQENALTRAYLDKIPFRGDIKERLTRLNSYAKRSLPWRGEDGKYYFYFNDGLQNQSVLYRASTPYGEDAEVFLDPNKLSDDGTVALTGVSQNPDGKYTAYTISRAGSDWTEIYVMETATGKLLDDHINWAKFTDAEWTPDGFYYSAYPRPEEGKEYSVANENHQIYFHRIGTPQSEDEVAFSDPAHPLHFHTAQLAGKNQEYFFVFDGGEGIGEGIRLRRNGSWVTIEPTQDYNHSILGVVDGKIYILTSYGASLRRIMTADINRPEREHWTELIPEGEGVISSAAFSGDNLAVVYEQDAANKLVVYDKSGKKVAAPQLPASPASLAISVDRKHPEDFFAGCTTFTSPLRVYSYDQSAGAVTDITPAESEGSVLATINPDDFVTEQVFFTSADGTKVPMFLTYKKGLKRDGNNPVYLYGYGGFNVSLNPGYNPNRMLWLENGGIYAQTNLRGGSEYGEKWHEAGTKLNKLNVFNDLIAAAEYMISEGWTKPELLTIEGGSNGGLLVGAVTNMRPDLFKVAIPRVGVMDMMRYHLFTIGWNWASDYGTSAESPEMAEYLLGYSPVHNIKNDGTPYPAILVTTADHDDRVVPAHSFKYAAALQAADTGDAPKLIRIDSNAGHGGGKPVSKVIDEYADIYSFIYQNLGITPETKK